jgi:hypothetical protein
MSRPHLLSTLGLRNRQPQKRDMNIDRPGSALEAVARPIQHRVEKRHVEEKLEKQKREVAMYGFLAGADHASPEVRERWAELSAQGFE